MTPDIKAIRAAAEAATPGPWEAAGTSFGDPLPRHLDCVGFVAEDGEFEDVCTAANGLTQGESTANMAFVQQHGITGVKNAAA